jgi:radical SAM superfamily enzyme YgiQ (UPF0313 family)
MKVALINSNRLKHPWPVIPFGLSRIAAALETEGHEVCFLDLCFSKDPPKAIKEMIGEFKPDAVGIGIRNIDNASKYKNVFFLDQIRDKVIRPCRTSFSGPIVIGGSAVGISGAQMLHFFDLEYAIRGDGEEAMPAFLKSLEGEASLDDVGGLIRRIDGALVIQNPPHRMENLETLPPINISSYVDAARYSRFGSPLQIQTKRGCALHCSYCTYNQIEGHTYRLRKPESVADEIERLVSETGIHFVEFTDSTFNIPLNHAKEVLRALSRKKIPIRYHTMGLNPAAVDAELVDLMKEVGFREVDLGAESCCDATLKTLGKDFTKKDVLRAGGLLRQAKIPTSWFLLVGAPGETEETMEETFTTVAQAASPWDLVVIGVGIRVYKGAPIAERLSQQDPTCTQDDFLHPAHYEPDGLDLYRIKRLTKRAYHRNPNFLMYDENSQYPAVVITGVNQLLRWFAPRQPIWRAYILVRKILKKFGVD